MRGHCTDGGNCIWPDYLNSSSSFDLIVNCPVSLETTCERATSVESKEKNAEFHWLGWFQSYMYQKNTEKYYHILKEETHGAKNHGPPPSALFPTCLSFQGSTLWLECWRREWTPPQRNHEITSVGVKATEDRKRSLPLTI